MVRRFPRRRRSSNDPRRWRRPPAALAYKWGGEAWSDRSRGGGASGAHRGGGKTTMAALISRKTDGAPVTGLDKK
jgi:hypothetical protein